MATHIDLVMTSQGTLKRDPKQEIQKGVSHGREYTPLNIRHKRTLSQSDLNTVRSVDSFSSEKITAGASSSSAKASTGSCLLRRSSSVCTKNRTGLRSEDRSSVHPG